MLSSILVRKFTRNAFFTSMSDTILLTLANQIAQRAEQVAVFTPCRIWERGQLFDAGCAASSKAIQGTEVSGTSGNVVEQETISTRGSPFR